MKFKLINIFIILVTITCIFTLSIAVVAASSEDPVVAIGDITRIKEIRENQLSGFGLVIGLAGTGDSNRYEPTIQSHANMLNNKGIEVTKDQVNSQNVAAVMVTASLPAFAHNGDTIDVTVSSLGDADSLQGGTLYMTPLEAPNGEIYAVAQGPVSIGGYNLQQGGNQVRQNHATAARVPNGAIVEKELNIEFDKEEFTYILENPNFETASNIVMAINDRFEYLFPERQIAKAVDSSQVKVRVPDDYKNDVVGFIAQIDNCDVRPGIDAKIVINEKTGTISITHNVRISTVSIAHGNLTVTVETDSEVSQPESLSEGETVETTDTDITVEEEENNITVMPTNNTIKDLVDALNKLGATSRDISAIIQEIKAQGALHAELVVQ